MEARLRSKSRSPYHRKKGGDDSEFYTSLLQEEVSRLDMGAEASPAITPKKHEYPMRSSSSILTKAAVEPTMTFKHMAKPDLKLQLRSLPAFINSDLPSPEPVLEVNSPMLTPPDQDAFIPEEPVLPLVGLISQFVQRNSFKELH